MEEVLYPEVVKLLKKDRILFIFNKIKSLIDIVATFWLGKKSMPSYKSFKLKVT